VSLKVLEVIVVVMFDKVNAVEGERKRELLRPFVYGVQDILHGLKLAVHENVKILDLKYSPEWEQFFNPCFLYVMLMA
jgi:hypothetical protein